MVGAVVTQTEEGSPQCGPIVACWNRKKALWPSILRNVLLVDCEAVKLLVVRESNAEEKQSFHVSLQVIRMTLSKGSEFDLTVAGQCRGASVTAASDQK